MKNSNSREGPGASPNAQQYRNLVKHCAVAAQRTWLKYIKSYELQVAQRVERELADRSELSRVQGQIQDAETHISKLQADLDYTRRVHPLAALLSASTSGGNWCSVSILACVSRALMLVDCLPVLSLLFWSDRAWRHPERARAVVDCRIKVSDACAMN
jgi:hypothetical protein